MNQNLKKILVLIIILFVFLGLRIIQADLYVENKLVFKREADEMFSLTRGVYTYTIAVGGTDGHFVIKNTSSAVIFKIDESGNIYFPGKIISNISLSDITGFPSDCATGTFIYGINDDAGKTFKCFDLSED